MLSEDPSGEGEDNHGICDTIFIMEKKQPHPTKRNAQSLAIRLAEPHKVAPKIAGRGLDAVGIHAGNSIGDVWAGGMFLAIPAMRKITHQQKRSKRTFCGKLVRFKILN